MYGVISLAQLAVICRSDVYEAVRDVQSWCQKCSSLMVDLHGTSPGDTLLCIPCVTCAYPVEYPVRTLSLLSK